MIVFFSGGSPIPEANLKNPSVMLSYFVNASKGKPDSRMKAILTIRKKARKRRGKDAR